MLIVSAERKTSQYCVVVLFMTAALFVESTAARDGSSTRRTTSPSTRPRSVRSDETADVDSRRLREGTIVSDQGGFFREDGEGATFVADTGMEFGALPNLNLERVVRLLKNADEPSSIRWSVTGRVTEFSGRNYLLVSRALYKSAAPPPVPDRVSQ